MFYRSLFYPFLIVLSHLVLIHHNQPSVQECWWMFIINKTLPLCNGYLFWGILSKRFWYNFFYLCPERPSLHCFHLAPRFPSTPPPIPLHPPPTLPHCRSIHYFTLFHWIHFTEFMYIQVSWQQKTWTPDFVWSARVLTVHFSSHMEYIPKLIFEITIHIIS